MDSYPGDLLVGVSPLVFTVDAILKRPDDDVTASTASAAAATTTAAPADPPEVNDFDRQDELGEGQPIPTAAQQQHLSNRSLFERFLDALAGSFDEEEAAAVAASVGSATATTTPGLEGTGVSFRRGSDALVSLFRGDDDDDDEEDDDSDDDVDIFDHNPSSSRRTLGTPSIGIYAGLGSRRGQLMGQASSNQHQRLPPIENTSFAKALQHGQGFFQRARIMSISTKHGLPPSKDPDGMQNRVFLLQQANNGTGGGGGGRNQHYGSSNPPSQYQLTTSFQRGLDGILPEGWLEKHVHALPSVILVLTRLTASTPSSPPYHQEEQDQRLMQTLEHLRYSLAPKRESHIHVVALVEEEVDVMTADSWSLDMLQKTNLKSQNITLLRIEGDLHSGTSDGMPTSAALRRLHKTVRDASFLYYMTQVKRNKRKHAALWNVLSANEESTHSYYYPQQQQHIDPNNTPPVLLPLAVRFCFKIAMFYEFQNKIDKSIKYVIHAYRHLEAYYRYLQSRALPPPPPPQQQHQAMVNPQQSDYGQHQPSRVQPTYAMLPPETATGDDGDYGGGFEVSLARAAPTVNINSMAYKVQAALVPPPTDMEHQCRAVADWLNFKVLQAGLKSKSPPGLVAAAAQWRRHSRAFLSHSNRRQEWYQWSFVAHQRLVMSQLVERHPPESSLHSDEEHDYGTTTPDHHHQQQAKRKAGAAGGGEHMEFLLQCSPWRSYEAATEATLRLGLELQKVQRQQGWTAGTGLDDRREGPGYMDKNLKRARYVGGLDREGLLPKLKQELQVNHREQALELILRAVSLFEREMQKATTEETENSWSRTGARLYYLAGGILLGMERHEEATLHLEKAAKYALGWRGLELAIRRLLIECYEKHVPEEQGETTEESSQTIASMILDSYFNAQMSSRNLRRSLENFAAHSGGGSLKWYHECVDESDASLPFSFAVTFPGTTQATAGETVKASVVIRSNLDYAVHINTVVLLSMAGHITIPSNDLLSAKNANEGTDGGIIIQAKKEILLFTEIELPKDVNIIAFDESGNGGVLQGIAGKGSFAKAARPRTAGVTSAAGARLISEELFGKGPNSSNAQWSLRFLGGRPLRCDGLQLTFYPVYVETTASGGSITVIELTIEKKKPKTAANIRRTPFEEDNYLASAWSRPHHLPLTGGPCCLRVLGPIPEMIVTNVTDPLTGGRALEGTVNRVLLRLQAGDAEICRDIKFRLTCGNTLLASDGTTRRIAEEESSLPEEGLTEDMKNPAVRTPVLVTPNDSDDKTRQPTEYGYELPIGWTLLGKGHGDREERKPPIQELQCGESTYSWIDLYRPSLPLAAQLRLPSDNNDESPPGAGSFLCQTDFDITVTYRQAKPSVQKHAIRRGSRRRKVVAASDPLLETDNAEKIADVSDLVVLEYSGSVVWTTPLTAKFSLAEGTPSFYPSGSRHPTNAISDTDETSETEIAVVDGQSFSAKCSLRATGAHDGLSVEIVKITFKDVPDPSARYTLTCLSQKGNDVLYTPRDSNDLSRILSNGSLFALAYTLEPKLATDVKASSSAAPQHISTRMGALTVDWRPVPLELPDDDMTTLATAGHGPLILSTPLTMELSGPPCYIESAPFETRLESFPATPQVAVPFDVRFTILNKTGLPQKLLVVLADVAATGGTPNSDDAAATAAAVVDHGILVAGLVNGEMTLSPFERQTLSYTALATRAGETYLPALSVTSSRYNSFVIREDYMTGRPLFVLP